MYMLLGDCLCGIVAACHVSCESDGWKLSTKNISRDVLLISRLLCCYVKLCSLRLD